MTLNALTPYTPASNVLVPRTMQDAMEMARMMATTGFLPREIQSAGGAMFVMEQAMRWNMSPFAVATEVSFVSGKPMFSGKIVAAAVQSSGILSGRLRYDYDGEGDNRAVTVSGTLRGEDEVRTVRVRLGDAKTNNAHWKGQPDQMLSYHGARVWARRHAPEVMLGVYSPEEMQEAPQEPRHVQAEPVHVPPATRPTLPGGLLEEVQKEATLPILAPDASLKAVPKRSWVKAVARAVAAMESADALRQWRAEMGPIMGSIAEAGDGDLVTQAKAEINRRASEFNQEENHEEPADA